MWKALMTPVVLGLAVALVIRLKKPHLLSGAGLRPALKD